MKFYVKINNEFYSQYSCSSNPTCVIPSLYSQYSCCCILKHQKKISLKPLLSHGILNFIFRPLEAAAVKLYEKQRPKLFTRKLKIRRDLLKFILKYFLNCYIEISIIFFVPLYHFPLTFCAPGMSIIISNFPSAVEVRRVRTQVQPIYILLLYIWS